MTRTPLIAGNWKMNGLQPALEEAKAIAQAADSQDGAEVLLCPPATLLTDLARALSGSRVKTGGQDCPAEESGAHTGDISAEMLAGAGADYVIVGHSERRADHGEDDLTVKAKAKAARRAGLTPIICVGEKEAERAKGVHLDVIEMQLDGSTPKNLAGDEVVIAYEPVWAIGTGRTAEPQDIAEMHEFIRTRLRHIMGEEADGVRILYGGSVKPGNAAAILGIDNVDGALVGGASLKAADFGPIIASAQSE